MLNATEPYDIKGNLTALINAEGQRTEFKYDLLGHRLRVDSPESGISFSIFDCGGNEVEKRNAVGEVSQFQYDELDRLKKVSFPDTGEEFADYTYHDAGQPAPPEAGAYTKGRLVKVGDQGGEVTFDYDALGRPSRKTIEPSALLGRSFTFDYEFRADGQIKSITYPEHAPGAGRRQVRYEYNRRGLLQRSSGSPH